MQRRKLTKKEKILLSVLVALIIIVIGAGAFLIVRNVNSANEQASNGSSVSASDDAASSKSASKSSSGETSTKKSSSKSSSASNSSSVSATDSVSSSGSDTSASSKTTTSKSSSKSSKTSSKSKSKGDIIKRVTPKKNTSHASDKTLKINGTTCYVGDTITIVLNITSQKSIVNYQGGLSFDSKYLKVKNVTSNSLGVANSNGTEVLYNASSLNGMDFSKTGTVFSATFEVREAGSTTVKNNLEIISELVDSSIKQLAETDYKVSVDIYS